MATGFHYTRNGQASGYTYSNGGVSGSSPYTIHGQPIGTYTRGGQPVTRADLQHVADSYFHSGGVGGLVENFFGGHTGVLPTLEHLPGGLVHLGAAAGEDLVNPSPKDPYLNHWSNLLHPVAYTEHYLHDPGTFGGKVIGPLVESYRQKYGHAALHHVYQDPFGTLLDATVIGSVAGRAALAGTKVAKAGEVAKAADNAASISRLGRVSSTSNRVIEYVPPGAKGLHTELDWARTLQTRLIQDSLDRYGIKHPYAPVVGAAKRVTKAAKTRNELRYGRDIAPARRYQEALRALKPEEYRAVRIIPELNRASEHPLADRIAYYERQLAKAGSQDEKAPILATIKYLHSIPESVITHPRAQVVTAIKAGRALAERGAAEEIKRGRWTPEMVQARTFLPHRLEGGATQAFARKVDEVVGQHEYDQQQAELGVMEKEIAKHERAIKRLYGGTGPRVTGEAGSYRVVEDKVPLSRLKNKKAIAKRRDEIKFHRDRLDSLRAQRDALPSRPKPETVTHTLPFEFIGGPTIEDLAAQEEGALKGAIPSGIHSDLGGSYYQPHIPLSNKPGAFTRGTHLPVGITKEPDAYMLNRGVAFAAGRIAHNAEVLTTSYVGEMKYLHMQDLKDEYVIPLSQELDSAMQTGKELGERYVRTKSAQIPGSVNRAEQATRETLGLTGNDEAQFRAWSKGEVFDGPPHGLPPGYKSVEEMKADGIRRIPAQVASQWDRQFHQTNKFTRLFWNRAMSVWKFLMLGLKPAWSVFNTVTNGLFYGLRWGGQGAIRSFLRALLTTERGPDKVRQIFKWTWTQPTLRRKYGRIMEEAIPGVHGSGFASSQLILDTHLGVFKEDWQLSRLQKIASRAGTGIQYASGFRAVRALGRANYKFNQASENLFRDAAALVEAKKFSKELGGANDTLEQILRKTGDNEALSQKLIDEINRGMGAFNHLGDFERNVIRTYVFPFYSWFKTVIAVTGHYAVDYPGRTLLLHQLGLQSENDPLASLPFAHSSWMNAFLPVGSRQGNEQKALSVGAASPWQTPADLLHALLGIGTDSQQGGAQNPANLLGPIPQGLITAFANKDLFYGGDYYGPGDKGFGPLPASPATRFFGSYLDLPEARLADQIRGRYKSKTYVPAKGQSPVPGLSENQYEALLQYLGIPIRRVNVSNAEQKAKGS